MTNIHQNEYRPDYVSPPGETLLETLEAIGMPQTELAKRMGRPVKTINEIIRNKASITAETALQLEQVLRIPASFWLNLEQQYQESLARLAEQERLNSWVEWLKEKRIPIQYMMERGWIPACRDKSQQVLESLKFFGVASPHAWQALWENKEVAYRKSTAIESNLGAVAAWLRQGELRAQEIECAPYKEEAFRDALTCIRALTVEPVNVFYRELISFCANAGVAVVFVPELPKTGICGSTQWLTPMKALVQLSLRYKTDDQLWYTFFHEAGHILLHGKRQIFLETEQKEKEKEEHEANIFAANILIPLAEWEQFTAQRSSCRSKSGIRSFAQRMGIAPGIVVGRLQHEGLLLHRHCNGLKRQLKWVMEEPASK
jgi:addiction module HigA family antidote